MKISELIIILNKLMAQHGDLPVHYDDDRFYPSEVGYCEYRESSTEDPLQSQKRYGEHIKLI